MVLFNWVGQTLRSYPELAIFLTLSLGFLFGKVGFKSFRLGAVTGTLLTGIVIGQLGIDISPQIKSIFFTMFLFSVGFGVGPQFVKGLANDGLSQAIFAVVICVLILATIAIISLVMGYGPGITAGLLAGSQTISASIGLATEAINKLPIGEVAIKKELSAIPVAYAVTYLFGTIGTGWIIAFIGPKLLGIDLEKECKRYEEEMSDGSPDDGIQTIWLPYVIRAYKLTKENLVAGKTVSEAEGMVKERVFLERLKRDGKIIPFDKDTVLKVGDIIAISGKQKILVEWGNHANEIADEDLLSIPVESVDVIITNRKMCNKSLIELANKPYTRGVYVNSIRRGAFGVHIPLLAQTKLEYGDIVNISGSKIHIEAIIKEIGYADKPTTSTDMVFVGLGIFIGGLLGAVVLPIGGVPITLSTSGGVLILGILCGWLRSFIPIFGNVPSSTLWFMNSVGLNIFIAVVGITAGPTFISGLKEVGAEIFVFGLLATSIPMLIAPYIGKYIFKFDPAINLGCCGGARTSTASVAMVADRAKSNVPMLGYTVPYAVSNTLLTLWGLIIISLIS